MTKEHVVDEAEVSKDGAVAADVSLQTHDLVVTKVPINIFIELRMTF